MAFIFYEVIKQVDLDVGQRKIRRRIAKASSEPNVAQYLMALAANYLELAEFSGAVRRQPATVVQLDGRRKAPSVGGRRGC